jgi:acyl carrier protein
MKVPEIAASIEKKYKIVIPEEQIPTLRSLQNLYELLEKLIVK